MKMNNNTIRINKNATIHSLDGKIQKRIYFQLRNCGMYEEDIQLVMSGKLRDIEDNVDIEEVFA